MGEDQLQPKIRWEILMMFLVTALVTLTLVPWYGFQYGFSPMHWTLFVVFMVWNGLSITAGYHRLWSHKSYRASLPVRFLFALGGALAVQNSIRVWCSNHRRHHRFVDDPDRDPYAATKGLWYSHIGWMLRDHVSARVTGDNIVDLDRDALVCWQARYYALLALSLNILLPLALGFLAGDAIGGLLLLGFLRLFLCHHTTFFINSLAHFRGRRPYSEKITARDNPIIALLTWGEGYHNYHHTFQWDYRNGLRWYQFDPTKWLIGALSWLRLTSELKRTPPEQIERSIASVQFSKARAAADNLMDAEIWIERLEQEYNALLETLNRWSSSRQEWLDLKKQNLAQQASELKARLKEIESELNAQRERWHLLHIQFA